MARRDARPLFMRPMAGMAGGGGCGVVVVGEGGYGDGGGGAFISLSLKKNELNKVKINRKTINIKGHIIYKL